MRVPRPSRHAPLFGLGLATHIWAFGKAAQSCGKEERMNKERMNVVDGETWYLYPVTYKGQPNQVSARSQAEADELLSEFYEILED